MVGNDDGVARTATEALDGRPTPALHETLGRYRLERVLGEGAMGTVHAAFDPDLERRVALKVLRVRDGAGMAEQRLLREARAMARVKHINVVAVHEVGSVDGRDYIAMELVDGETLDHWLRASRRSTSEIVDAFVAAGRGLAAAHAAGLVHRDFKPNNVLRQRDGRIVVTDFGLARGLDGAADVSEPGIEVASPNQSSPLIGLTATGALMGTPAYMAPEQWSGGAVGPAADQFSFCVALWEALTGDRPFRGKARDDLKAMIQRGAAALDSSKLPRPVRGVLQRGLDADPAKRWPTMDAMLVAIKRRQRRRRIAIAAGIAVVAATPLLYVSFGRSTDACEPPATDVATVWSPARALALARGDQPIAAALIERDVARWQATRGRVCRAAASSRAAALACLDHVLARLALVTDAAGAARTPRLDAGAALIDPAVCERERLPRFTASSPLLLEMMTRSLEASDAPRRSEVHADQLLARAGSDPCAAAIAHTLAANTGATNARTLHLDEADRNAERCGDDRIAADVAIAAARTMLGNAFFDRETSTRVKRAEGLVAAVPQRDLEGELELLRMEVAKRADDLDGAIAHAGAAAQAFAERGRVRRQVAANLEGLALRELRGRPADLTAIAGQHAAWRGLALVRLGADDAIVQRIDQAVADWALANGDLVTAHAMWDKLRRPIANVKPIRVTGRVIDARGTPVAGATVIAGGSLRADSRSIAARDAEAAPSLRQASTAADGTFELTDVASEGVIVAEHGAERSAALAVADNVTLQLAPTSRIRGTVDLRGEPSTNVIVVAADKARPLVIGYELFAPVLRDGSFELAGVPRGRVVVRTQVERAIGVVVRGTEIDVARPEVDGVRLVVGTSKRFIHVIVRSTVGMALPNAQVIVLPGHVAATNAADLNRNLSTATVRLARPPDSQHSPSVVLAKVEPGDLYASINDIPLGPISACAVALPADLSDPAFQKMATDHLDQIAATCVSIASDDPVVLIEVPPFPRLD